MGHDEVHGLLEEIENWRDNLEGTNLENTAKHEKLEPCADELTQYCDDIESAMRELESIEFPGMY